MGTLGLLARPHTQTEYGIMVNYNGQADLLLSLQIPPDYYPYQFKRFTLYDYLTDAAKYMVANGSVSPKKLDLKSRLQPRIDDLMSHIREYGPSLWNEDLYDSGIVFRNSQFWNTKRTTLLFLEQFIADDYPDIRNSYGLLPSHRKLIVTNYRAARDPYTIFSKRLFDCFNGSSCDGSNQKLYSRFKGYMDTYDREDTTSLYRFGRFIDFWNNLITRNETNLKTLRFYDLIKEDNKHLFSIDGEQDRRIAQKYLRAVFDDEDRCMLNRWQSGEDGGSCPEDPSSGQTDSWSMEYLRSDSSPQPTHHPAMEQQLIPGSAPLSEGSQKDIIVFLYQFAASIDAYTREPSFASHFGRDHRKTAMENALNNAYLMSKGINERIKNIRDYFKAIGVVDRSFDPEKQNYTTDSSKTFTVLTYPPSAFGAGEATIQSMSKFPWLYRDIGLKQPIPSDISAEDREDPSDETFSVDDNGWWWKIGSANLNPTNLLKFRRTTDTLLLLANEDDWNLLQDRSSGTLSATASLLRDTGIRDIDLSRIQGNEPSLLSNSNYPVSYNRYHLWNEGLRSPIALNLLFDNLVDIFQRQYHSPLKGHVEEYRRAMDWGDYWHIHFLNGTHSPPPSQ